MDSWYHYTYNTSLHTVGCTVLYHPVLWYMRTGWAVGITIGGVVHRGTFYLVLWYMRMRCTLYQADYSMVHNRTEAQSRTCWDILGLVWTFVGNPGHVWREHPAATQCVPSEHSIRD